MDKPVTWYLHVDLDAFFASVEQLDNPELRGKPVIVGGKPEDRRSVVSTASYEARAFGVHSAMPVFQAYKLCPQGIFVHGRMHRYAELSHQIMSIFRDYSPDVDQMSIDEAFIDLTGTEKLFGPPEETARAIKKRVKEETGLTVSIGLARTKYLAKIASGLSKPDGFYHIKHGTEESFMLNLPLTKVWGLGPKSLELIRSKGLSSTRDIYEKDYDTLEFLFGKNMADFLYNVVRGIEKESFKRESKSHSISAETTFPYDLTDIYTIETELMELAHGVFFRLLKEESFSRTAMVKIRYEDFSTSTVQETVERNIITLDSFFEIIKRLFEKRYEKGRGIRLLGVGFENVVTEDKPYQQDLFSDNKDEKKQAVEKAILGLSKKHPEIKVSKARTLKLILFAILIGTIPSKIQAEDKIPDQPLSAPLQEGPSSLFDYDINDKNHVEFTASGMWKADFEGGLNLTFGKGTDFAASPVMPVFKQETDIATKLILNNHWYFEAAFADEFTRNTLAFGYNGDGLIRSFRLANRGVTMQEGYSAEHFGYSLRGGNNQAPGALLQLSSPSDKIKADFLLRYDMTETRSAIYYGMNKVSDTHISVENFAYGREFRFPLPVEIDAVYIESAGGSYKDSRGRRYKKLSHDEWSVAAVSHHLLISSAAGGGLKADGSIPSILVTLRAVGDSGTRGGGNTLSEANTLSAASTPNAANTPSAGSRLSAAPLTTLLTAAGSYSEAESFLGQIQQELGQKGKYKLEEYSYELTTSINDEPALIIQNYQGFSPFLCPYIYDSGSKKNADYLVIADKSELPVSKYKALENDESSISLYEDFFEKEQGSVKIINKDTPQSFYPFASDCPEIYLGLPQQTDLSIRARSYSPVSELLISKNAAAGTVQVYKNGSLLTGTLFNENTGQITLNTTVNDSDQILITWQEEASDFTSGALAAAAGLKINFLPELLFDLSLSARQSVNQKENFTDYNSQKNSFVALSTGLTYEKNGLTLKEKAALSFLNDNTSKGLLLYDFAELQDAYLKEKASNPDTKNPEPEKSEKLCFSTRDFSPYKTIKIELSFEKESENDNDSNFSGPLLLTLDEDTGTSVKGREAVSLQLYDISLFAEKGGRHSLTIFTDGSSLLADGREISKAAYSLKINKEIYPSRLTLDAGDKQKALIERLTYNDAESYATVRNYIAAGYQKDDLFKINIESDQGSGNLSDPQPFVNAKAATALKLYGLQFSGDAAVEVNKNTSGITEAGHSLKSDGSLFIFRLISAEDTYRYRPSSDELRKDNAFALDLSPLKVPLKTALKTSATDSLFNQKQNAEITSDFSAKFSDFNFAGGVKLAVGQKISRAQEIRATDDFPNYGNGWFDISKLEFSTGSSTADSRDSLWSAYLSGAAPLADSGITIKPKLTYELSDNWKAEGDISSGLPLFTDKEYLQLLLPFSKEKISFTFEHSRTAGGSCKTNSINDTTNYASDTEKLFALQNERDWFYTSIPVYELFDTSLSEKVKSSYAAKYEGSFRRSLYNSIKDLYIPSSVSLAISREIKNQKPETDLYQIKTVITNNSINNFGSQSISKIFDWFQQEELVTSLTTIVKIPSEEPSNFRLKLQGFGQLLLFIKEKTLLTEQLDFALENTADWNLRDTLAYTRPSQTSLLTGLITLLSPETKISSLSISRKDSFTLELGRNSAILQQKYSLNHTVGIDFLSHYNVNAGIGGSLTLNQEKADSLSINLSIGAKAEF